MNALTPTSAHNVYSAAQINLIRQTVAKDCNTMEFDLFVTVARNAGLDPFRKQISAIVFNKDNDKRPDGHHHDHRRPALHRRSQPPLPAGRGRAGVRIRRGLKDPTTNPLGIVKAVGEDLHRVTLRAREAGARSPASPIGTSSRRSRTSGRGTTRRGKRKPTGKQTLDGNWPKMGRVMICKCAEAQALRKAFPEDLSGLYEGAEMDRARAGDLSASERIERSSVENRLERAGIVNTILFQMFPNWPLEAVPLGKVADRVVRGHQGLGPCRCWLGSRAPTRTRFASSGPAPRATPWS
jgi:phage recombination protein Bet